MSECVYPTCYYRCLFCRSKEEEKVARTVCERHLGMAIFPQKVEPFGRKGTWHDIAKPLLPGYVFVCSDAMYPQRKLQAIEDVLRVLTYGQLDHDGYLVGQDRRFAERLFQQHGMINKLEAVQEGSYVRIVDGLLKDYNGKVEKVDKRKRMACLTLDILGAERQIWLGYEVLEEKKADTKNQADFCLAADLIDQNP